MTVFVPTNLIQSFPNNFCYLLELRQNIVDYVDFIHIFAPCVVSCAKWKDHQSFDRLQTGNAMAFNELLTPSDEAFILLVFINYAERWYAELQVSNCKMIT